LRTKLLVTALLVCSVPAFAAFDVPDIGPSSADCIGCPAALRIEPNGQGPTLADVGVEIVVTVLDASGNPIAGYPFQDIWLDDLQNGELNVCQGGSVADRNTDATGVSVFTGAIAGGGFSQAGMLVYLAGQALPQFVLEIDVNSPDITGDLTVNMADVGAFAAGYATPELDFEIDLLADGLENLGDIGALAAAFGTTCR